jgi:hypothetical protein
MAPPAANTPLYPCWEKLGLQLQHMPCGLGLQVGLHRAPASYGIVAGRQLSTSVNQLSAQGCCWGWVREATPVTPSKATIWSWRCAETYTCPPG